MHRMNLSTQRLSYADRDVQNAKIKNGRRIVSMTRIDRGEHHG
jgi:hypothetical protein